MDTSLKYDRRRPTTLSKSILDKLIEAEEDNQDINGLNSGIRSDTNTHLSQTTGLGPTLSTDPFPPVRVLV